MLTIRPIHALAALLLSSLLDGAVGAPQRQRGGEQQLTAQEQAAQIPDGISEATDGTTILDMTVEVKFVPTVFP